LIDYKPLLSRQFAKDSGRLIEEKKLRVVLISPSSSPVLLPVNGDMKHDPSNEIDVQKDRVLSGVENIPPRTVSSSFPSLPFELQFLSLSSSCFRFDDTIYIFFRKIYLELL